MRSGRFWQGAFVHSLPGVRSRWDCSGQYGGVRSSRSRCVSARKISRGLASGSSIREIAKC